MLSELLSSTGRGLSSKWNTTGTSPSHRLFLATDITDHCTHNDPHPVAEKFSTKRRDIRDQPSGMEMDDGRAQSKP